LERSIPGFKMPSHGDLTDWLNQGVLLLNMHLTCKIGEPGSHAKFGFWNKIIPRILKYIEGHNRKCIYILLGRQAASAEKYIGEKAIKLYASHPSGLSAYKTDNPFIGSNIFVKTNKELINQDKTPINWFIN